MATPTHLWEALLPSNGATIVMVDVVKTTLQLVFSFELVQVSANNDDGRVGGPGLRAETQ